MRRTDIHSEVLVTKRLTTRGEKEVFLSVCLRKEKRGGKPFFQGRLQLSDDASFLSNPGINKNRAEALFHLETSRRTFRKSEENRKSLRLSSSIASSTCKAIASRQTEDSFFLSFSITFAGQFLSKNFLASTYPASSAASTESSRSACVRGVKTAFPFQLTFLLFRTRRGLTERKRPREKTGQDNNRRQRARRDERKEKILFFRDTPGNRMSLFLRQSSKRKEESGLSSFCPLRVILPENFAFARHTDKLAPPLPPSSSAW